MLLPLTLALLAPIQDAKPPLAPNDAVLQPRASAVPS